MRVVEKCQCPVCKRWYGTEEKAKQCRESHPIKISRWYYCEICGAGYEDVTFLHAAKIAKECEAKHKKDGNAEDVGMQTYFLSGGFMGKPKILIGGRG